MICSPRAGARIIECHDRAVLDFRPRFWPLLLILFAEGLITKLDLYITNDVAWILQVNR